MVSRRFALRSLALGFCLALTAFGGWAVRPYLPGPPRPAAEAAPESTEDLIARLEDLRSQKREWDRRETEFRKEMWAQKAEIERQERVILSELKKREEENQHRLATLGHQTSSLARRYAARFSGTAATVAGLADRARTLVDRAEATATAEAPRSP